MNSALPLVRLGQGAFTRDIWPEDLDPTFRNHGDPMTATSLMTQINRGRKAGALAPTLHIIVEKKAGDQFERVVAHRLGDKPPRLDSDEGLPDRAPEPAGMTLGIPDDEIPF